MSFILYETHTFVALDSAVWRSAAMGRVARCLATQTFRKNSFSAYSTLLLARTYWSCSTTELVNV